MSLPRSLLTSLPRLKPSFIVPPPIYLTKRHASYGGKYFTGIQQLIDFRGTRVDPPIVEERGPAVGKGVFDTAVEEGTKLRQAERKRIATFHKSSTANFKASRRKLNDLGRLIAGRGVDEGVLQLTVSPKKPASRLLSMLALARDHAIAKGLNRDKLVIAQAWTTKGPALRRVDIKGRGRRGIKEHQSSKLHVLLAEGMTTEEKRRQRKKDSWRSSIRGLTEDSVGVGRARPIVNTGVGNWRW